MRYLTEIEIQELVDQNPSWKLIDKGFEKEYEFDSFLDAIKMMNELSVEVDKLDHHPQWKNVYKTLWIRVSSYDYDGLTEKDILLLKLINDYFGES